MSRDEIEVVYRVGADGAPPGPRAEALLLEQTVELPRAAIRSARVLESMVGRVVSAGPAEGGGHRVTLAQPALAAAADPAQLLNVLFGNCSLQPDIELLEVRVPAALAARLGGPRFGAEGFRALAGAKGRALTASVLKPVGLSVPETAALCGVLARSGLDFVKDDHGLADHPFCPFGERVRACLGATEAAARETGHRTIYIPNLIGTPSAVRAQARLAADLGVQAVMVSPMIVGLPFLAELAAEASMPILAHPAFGGATRIAPEALLGTLFPLFGADGVIFPNAGGRFSYSRGACRAITAALGSPHPGLRASMAVPAGGIRVENLPGILEFYGRDAMLLIGGSLLESPDAATLLARCRAFVEAVHAFAYPA
jgi:ribulose-bisphosphate carboxylase large chain